MDSQTDDFDASPKELDYTPPSPSSQPEDIPQAEESAAASPINVIQSEEDVRDIETKIYQDETLFNPKNNYINCENPMRTKVRKSVLVESENKDRVPILQQIVEESIEVVSQDQTAGSTFSSVNVAPQKERGDIEQEQQCAVAKPVPKIIFIVPYRDRESQLLQFSAQMKLILEDTNQDDYAIYYAHQCDTRTFNRGAVKNIGFMVLKNKYPDDYKDITFVFNDVDTMPSAKGLIDYGTKRGTIKHFYGYNYTLGGIVSITGDDFERLNGFPQYWAWGFEDNLFNHRAMQNGVRIDRSQFYTIQDERIIHLKNGTVRDINSGEFQRYLQKNTEGISNVSNVMYSINPETKFINIFTFKTGYEENANLRQLYDTKNGPMPFKIAHPIRRNVRMHMML
jgi:hypothetical protein